MSLIVTIVFCLMGAIYGFLIPSAVQKMEIYKCEKKGMELLVDMRVHSLPVSWTTLIVNSAAWTLASQKSETIWEAVLISILFSVAILVAMIDLELRIIPNELVLVMLILGIALQLVRFGITSLFTAVLSMLVMMALFIGVSAVIGFGTVGGGDVKLIGVMGLILGYPSIVSALIVMGVALLLYSLAGLIFRKVTLHSMIPLAPFMMLGLVVALISVM